MLGQWHLIQGMTGGEESGGPVQGEHAPWGLFNLSSRTPQSTSLSNGGLIPGLKRPNRTIRVDTSLLCLLMHMFLK